MEKHWQERLKSWVVPQPRPTAVSVAKVDAGMYHYQRARDDGYMRFHLRVERSGESLLIAGASEVLRLSLDWTSVMKRLLDGEDPQSLARSLPAGAESNVAQGVRVINELGGSSSRFPVFNLSDPGFDSRGSELVAPFQADVDVRDLKQLKPILHSLWDAGIPHARLLPDSKLNDDDLVQAVEWSEDIGMITGVRTTAGWLMESDRIKRLAAVGADYLLFPWAVDSDLHATCFGDGDFNCLTTAIARALEQEVTPVVEIPLIGSSIDGLDDQWQRLVDWKVSHVEVYALARMDSPNGDQPKVETEGTDKNSPLEASQLRQLAAWVEETADQHDFQVTWLPPVAVTDDDKMIDKIRRGPRAGGDVSIRVLPNADVLPARGASQPAGNLLSNRWDEIWGSPVFHRYRERVESNTRCEQCPGMATCAGDCPADPKGWSHD